MRLQCSAWLVECPSRASYTRTCSGWRACRGLPQLPRRPSIPPLLPRATPQKRCQPLTLHPSSHCGEPCETSEPHGSQLVRGSECGRVAATWLVHGSPSRPLPCSDEAASCDHRQAYEIHEEFQLTPSLVQHIQTQPQWASLAKRRARSSNYSVKALPQFAKDMAGSTSAQALGVLLEEGRACHVVPATASGAFARGVEAGAGLPVPSLSRPPSPIVPPSTAAVQVDVHVTPEQALAKASLFRVAGRSVGSILPRDVNLAAIPRTRPPQGQLELVKRYVRSRRKAASDPDAMAADALPAALSPLRRKVRSTAAALLALAGAQARARTVQGGGADTPDTDAPGRSSTALSSDRASLQTLHSGAVVLRCLYDWWSLHVPPRTLALAEVSGSPHAQAEQKDSDAGSELSADTRRSEDATRTSLGWGPAHSVHRLQAQSALLSAKVASTAHATMSRSWPAGANAGHENLLACVGRAAQRGGGSRGYGRLRMVPLGWAAAASAARTGRKDQAHATLSASQLALARTILPRHALTAGGAAQDLLDATSSSAAMHQLLGDAPAAGELRSRIQVLHAHALTMWQLCSELSRRSRRGGVATGLGWGAVSAFGVRASTEKVAVSGAFTTVTWGATDITVQAVLSTTASRDCLLGLERALLQEAEGASADGMLSEMLQDSLLRTSSRRDAGGGSPEDVLTTHISLMDAEVCRLPFLPLHRRALATAWLQEALEANTLLAARRLHRRALTSLHKAALPLHQMPTRLLSQLRSLLSACLSRAAVVSALGSIVPAAASHPHPNACLRAEQDAMEHGQTTSALGAQASPSPDVTAALCTAHFLPGHLWMAWTQPTKAAADTPTQRLKPSREPAKRSRAGAPTPQPKPGSAQRSSPPRPWATVTAPPSRVHRAKALQSPGTPAVPAALSKRVAAAQARLIAWGKAQAVCSPEPERPAGLPSPQVEEPAQRPCTPPLDETPSSPRLHVPTAPSPRALRNIARSIVPPMPAGATQPVGRSMPGVLSHETAPPASPALPRLRATLALSAALSRFALPPADAASIMAQHREMLQASPSTHISKQWRAAAALADVLILLHALRTVVMAPLPRHLATVRDALLARQVEQQQGESDAPRAVTSVRGAGSLETLLAAPHLREEALRAHPAARACEVVLQADSFRRWAQGKVPKPGQPSKHLSILSPAPVVLGVLDAATVAQSGLPPAALRAAAALAHGALPSPRQVGSEATNGAADDVEEALLAALGVGWEGIAPTPDAPPSLPPELRLAAESLTATRRAVRAVGLTATCEEISRASRLWLHRLVGAVLEELGSAWQTLPGAPPFYRAALLPEGSGPVELASAESWFTGEAQESPLHSTGP